MVLFTFHYIVTSFFLSIWFGYPQNTIWVTLIHFLLQLILYLSGFDWRGTDNGGTFWGWQTLATFEGLLLASLFLFAFRAKHTFLKIEIRYERVWFTWLVSTAAFIGGQVFYGTLPPTESAYGILFTILVSLIVLIGTGYSLLFDNVVFEHSYDSNWVNKKFTNFFAWWILLTLSMQAMFWIARSGLGETWVALISGSVVLLFIGILWFFNRK